MNVSQFEPVGPRLCTRDTALKIHVRKNGKNLRNDPVQRRRNWLERMYDSLMRNPRVSNVFA